MIKSFWPQEWTHSSVSICRMLHWVMQTKIVEHWCTKSILKIDLTERVLVQLVQIWYGHSSSCQNCPRRMSSFQDVFPFPQFSSLTPWRLMLFLNFEENIPAKLKGGDVVRLFHVHEGKFLTLDAPQSEPGRQYIFLRTTLRASATTAVSSNALWEVEVRSLVFFNSSAVIYVNYVNC